MMPLPQPKPPSAAPYQLYWQRYYVLALFSMAGMVMHVLSNCFAPIAESLRYAYGWDSGVIALQNLVQLVTSGLTVIPVCFGINRLRIRKYLIFALVFLTISTILLVLPVDAFVLGVISVVWNGGLAVGIGLILIPNLLSVTWFSERHWRTAAGIGLYAAFLGDCLAFLIGPNVVPDPQRLGTNETQESVGSAIQTYLGSLLGLTAVITLITIVYFPDHPPTPPSLAAERNLLQDSVSVLKIQLKTIFKSKDFWLCVADLSLVDAPVVAAGSLLLPYIRPLGINQQLAGYVGIAGLGAVLPVAGTVAKIGDVTKTKLKEIAIICATVALVASIFMGLMRTGILAHTVPRVFVVICFYMAFAYANVNLLFELSCECLYPIAEELVTCALVVTAAGVGGIIFAIFLAAGIESPVVDVTLVVSTALGLGAACFLPRKYYRTAAALAVRDHRDYGTMDSERQPLIE